MVANQRHRVVHFMGHGGQDEQVGAFLCLEKENGTLDAVTARQFVQRVRGSVFLVTLNACVSATPGPTPFSNLAAALVRQKVPYALGMRVSIHDDDARDFSRQFYSELASGVPVEEALFQARLTLASSSRHMGHRRASALHGALSACRRLRRSRWRVERRRTQTAYRCYSFAARGGRIPGAYR